ncbi:helix-turn-helix domain-containing protein [Staphylococcus gallinarum]|uniref:helix-turn-helix domain-containing protein n=1 Tax=Staphylococcus gallinarum TaxID=1293 RepID=UPI001E4E60DC|nr:helix-turn-helix transcriptional regulator [Staphylococcus gallinarum]MCD8787462.1 helix-turn-helix transcriptional regulator [Staphylococcus gallinarum]MCD8845270.1 helix-turn-helix transcriptional regulator [Staphylococcus gallinarum]
MELISKLIQEDINNNSELEILYKEQGEKLEFAIAIINLRKSIGWSQVELAQKLKVPQTTIENIENGDVLPTMSLLRSIADVTEKELRISFV